MDIDAILNANKLPKNASLRGFTFTIAGMLTNRSLADAKELIEANGGALKETFTSDVNYVLSSAEMESVYANEYKSQFFPDLKSKIDLAKRKKIAILSEDFLDKCVSLDKKAKIAPYILFEPKNVQKGFEFQSKLDPRVQELVNWLFDESEMERSLGDMNLDAARLMTEVTAQTVKQAYGVLSEIDGVVRSSPFGAQEKQTQAATLKTLSDKFFKLIPHKKGSTTPVLSSVDSVKDKLKMMESISDIEVAARLMKQGRGGGSLAPVDGNYRKLKCAMTPLEKHLQEYSFIEQYVQNTHAASHSHFSLEIENVFKIEREGEAERFKTAARLPNHRLLWHGSRFTNFIGILTQGLRVAPPEAPVTGYFLGKGIYLADMVSKSAEYLHANKESPTGLMLLCESALGRWFQLAHGKFICKEDLDEAGFHSTKCCGELAPDASFDYTTEGLTGRRTDGYVMPLGRETETGVLCSELVHNEFVVYDPAQVLLRYLVKVRFEFHEGRPGQISS